MNPKLRIEDLELSGKKVFLRVDFNVPLREEAGRRVIESDKRIRAALPTVRYALEKGASLVVASHLGRPKGRPNPAESLLPVAEALSAQLGRPVPLAPDCVGPEVDRMKAALAPGGVLLLENLRFHAEEEKNDPGFGAALVSGCDLYVNDAFGTAHRAHASVVAAPRALGRGAMGLLMAAEVESLQKVLGAPAKPFLGVLGGAKVSDKLPILKNLLGRVDTLCVGGAMAYTFLRAMGHPTGVSLVEQELVGSAGALLREAEAKRSRLLLPLDHVLEDGRTVGLSGVGAEDRAFDIGPETRAAWAREIAGARTVVWNGPLGMFEKPPFDAGTRAIAQALASSSAFFVIGGGDSVAAVKGLGLETRNGHISTGGGAMLEFLAGDVLPGVEAISGR